MLVNVIQGGDSLGLYFAATDAGKAHQAFGLFGCGGLHHTFVPTVGQGGGFAGDIAVTASASVGGKAFCGAGRLGNDGSILVNVIQGRNGLGLYRAATSAGKAHQTLVFLGGGGLYHTGIPMVIQRSGLIGDVAVTTAAAVGGETFGSTSGGGDHGDITVNMLQLGNGLELCVAATGAGKAHQAFGLFGCGGLYHTFVPTVIQRSGFIGDVAVTTAATVGDETLCRTCGIGDLRRIAVDMSQGGNGLGLFSITAAAGEVHQAFGFLGSGGLHHTFAPTMLQCGCFVGDVTVTATAAVGGEAFVGAIRIGDQGGIAVDMLQFGNGLGFFSITAAAGEPHQAFGLFGCGGLHDAFVPAVGQGRRFIGDVTVTAAAAVGGETLCRTSGFGDLGRIAVDMLQFRNGLGGFSVTNGAGKAHQALGFLGGGNLHHTFAPTVAQRGHFIGDVMITAKLAGVAGIAFVDAIREGDGSIVAMEQNATFRDAANSAGLRCGTSGLGPVVVVGRCGGRRCGLGGRTGFRCGIGGRGGRRITAGQVHQRCCQKRNAQQQ